VLPARHFVMGGFDVESHALERRDNIPARLFAAVDRREVEIAPYVMGDVGRFAVRAALEKKKLHLRADPEFVPRSGCLSHHFLEGCARQPVEGRSVRQRMSQIMPRYLARRSSQGKTRNVAGSGRSIMSASSARKKPRWRTIEHHLSLQRPPELGFRNLHILDRAQDVCELEAQKRTRSWRAASSACSAAAIRPICLLALIGFGTRRNLRKE